MRGQGDRESHQKLTSRAQGVKARCMLQNLETLSREARSWPFEQARNLLAHVLKKRLSDAERDAAKLLIDAFRG